jgi:hypothetical protein
MNNDILYVILMIVVILILIGIVYFWIKTSNKQIKTGTSGNNASGSLSSLYSGIYDPAKINQRCSDGTGPNITPSVLLPGFNVPPPCGEGFACIKVNPETDPYGYCKAKLGSKCNTIYDCAPIGASLGPTGLVGQTVFCNNVCSNRITGDLLTGCTNKKITNATGTVQFKCDASQNLVCNNVTKPPTNSCFTKYGSPCNTDDECLGGVCFAPTVDGIKQTSVCYCPSIDSNINLQVCVYVDGQRCKYNQECYGGVCQKDGTSDFGICQSRYFPGKPCELGPNGEDACLQGYGCAPYNELVGRICQPLIIGPSGTQFPAETNKVNSLCTDYNVYSGIGPSGPVGPESIQPILTCDNGLICNYDFSTRVPVDKPNVNYLKGFGTCQQPLSKIGQTCSNTSACMYPGICIQDENGIGICSRPQYFNENESMTIYINNPTEEGIALVGYTGANLGQYNTLMVQLVGGGGGGQYGTFGSTGFYGGGGGGSGQIFGYIPVDDYKFNVSGSTGTFQYKNSNVDGLYPNPYIIDLESFEWDIIKVSLGAGGNGSNFIVPSTIIPATKGGSTTLTFENLSSIVKTISIDGGIAGGAPIPALPISNGIGGTGFNGGGAGSGGLSTTTVAEGGNADLANGGQSGEFTKGLNNSSKYNGNGGGIGGGPGKDTSAPLTFGTSCGGGGGGGSCVNYLFNNILTPTGGSGGSSSSKNSIYYPRASTSGLDYTGAGGGGGSMYLGNIPLNGSAGGKGYAILHFSKVYKDINYAGQENPNVLAPPSGSSGKCTLGFLSNGLYQITGNGLSVFTGTTGITGPNGGTMFVQYTGTTGATGSAGPEFCIPEQYYTCNTYNPNFSGGSLCMNSNKTLATGVCGTNSIGIFIPIPPNIGAKKGSVVTESFGKWHFLNLPNQSDPSSVFNANSSISVFQLPGDDLYPVTRLIYHPFNDTYNSQTQVSTFFYYTEFSVKDISPNNPLNKLQITPQWYKILVSPDNSQYSTNNSLNSICDIKFTTGGNFGMIVNENGGINFPFIPGNGSAGPSTSLPYYRIYSSVFSNLVLNSVNSTGTLTYPASNKGPMFCGSGFPNGDLSSYGTPTLFNGMYMNNVSFVSVGKTIRPYDKFIWDIDDTYNKSVCICFKDLVNPTSKYFIFSDSFITDVNELNQLSTTPFHGDFAITGFSSEIIVELPRSLKFYTDSYSPSSTNPYKYVWEQRNATNSGNEVIVFYDLTTPASVIKLQELAQEQSIVFSFNRLNDLALFDFYYASSNDEFKYVTSNINTSTSTVKYNSNELQVPGYLPTLMTNGTFQTIFNFLAMGNLDRSMYAIVNTCS